MLKYTDEQIKKALECCKRGELNDCEDCPCFEDGGASTTECIGNLLSNALDLINRQEAEIERLKKNNKTIMQTIADIHTEAIKEFAERLGETVTYYEDECNAFVPFVDCRDIDNLVKEMVGESK